MRARERAAAAPRRSCGRGRDGPAAAAGVQAGRRARGRRRPMIAASPASVSSSAATRSAPSPRRRSRARSAALEGRRPDHDCRRRHRHRGADRDRDPDAGVPRLKPTLGVADGQAPGPALRRHRQRHAAAGRPVRRRGRGQGGQDDPHGEAQPRLHLPDRAAPAAAASSPRTWGPRRSSLCARRRGAHDEAARDRGGAAGVRRHRPGRGRDAGQQRRPSSRTPRVGAAPVNVSFYYGRTAGVYITPQSANDRDPVTVTGCANDTVFVRVLHCDGVTAVSFTGGSGDDTLQRVRPRRAAHGGRWPRRRPPHRRRRDRHAARRRGRRLLRARPRRHRQRRARRDRLRHLHRRRTTSWARSTSRSTASPTTGSPARR